MIQRLFRTITAAMGIALATGALVGCAGTSADAAEEAVDTGSLRLPLTTEVNGRTYRLNTTIYLWPNGMALQTSDSPEETLLSVEIPSGSYSAQLYGWSLERRDDESGQFIPVNATLSSSSYVSFSIFSGTTTSISFTFETAGEIVTVGAGSLNVDVEVNEVAPACTPLGDTCGEGYWCPPANLTGSLLSCLPSGSTPLNAPCSGPLECVSNASCFDLGQGPRCIRLCGPAEFGAACASGGVCEQAGAEYGLCTPASGE